MNFHQRKETTKRQIDNETKTHRENVVEFCFTEGRRRQTHREIGQSERRERERESERARDRIERKKRDREESYRRHFVKTIF